MDTRDPNHKPDEHVWPPPPAIAPPSRSRVDDPVGAMAAQIAAGFVVGVLSPVAVMSVIGDIANAFQFTGGFADALPALAVVALFVIQLAVFAFQRKRRPVFAKAYVVTSLIAGIGWCLRLYGFDLA